jgi:hypothetical protein
MNRKTRLTLRMKAKDFSFEGLVKTMSRYIVLLITQPNHPKIKQRMRELIILRQEMKVRGFDLLPHVMGMGIVMEVLPNDPILLALPDHKAMGPVVMDIPSIDTILSYPLPSDLPQHGYIHQ